MHPPATGRLVVWDAALPGFGVRITENGKRSWVLTTRLRGRPVYLTLGTWPATPLTRARDLAREAINDVAKGNDPRAKKKRPAAVPHTFAAVAKDFVEKWAKPRNRTWEETERKLERYVTPTWGTRCLAEITRADVVQLLDTIATDNGPIMANRVLATVKRLFSWSLDRGLIDTHPVARLAPPGAEMARSRVLTDNELRALWTASDTYPWGTAMRLLMLTGARRGEVSAMARTEYDLDERLWVVPAERVKTKRPHAVPLVPAAVTLLRDCPEFDGCPYVFTTGGRTHIHDWSGATTTLTKAAGFNGWTPHDVRRTVRTNLSKLGVSADVAERVLGHAMPGVRATYDHWDYLEQKRDALERWAAHLTALVERHG
jgi:integrase